MLVATRDREVSPMRVTELRFAPSSTPIDPDAQPLVVSAVVL
jgi:hypothetical protein